MKSASLILFTTIAFARLAAASPAMDPKLQAVMADPSRANETVRVIALFKDVAPVKQYAHHITARVQVEREMINNAQKSQLQFTTQLKQLMQTEGVQLKAQRLWLINGMLLEMPASQLAIFKNSTEVAKVIADYPVGLIQTVGDGTLVENPTAGNYTYGLQKLQIPELRGSAKNVTGKGVRVGIVDTGIDGTHPDLKDRVVAFKDFISNKPVAYDDNKHGTHCAGTIGGHNLSGTQIGVAPDVQYIGAKFLDKNGSGSFAGAIAAMQWIADPDNNPNTNDGPMVVSNSWGGGSPSANEDPANNALCKATEGWLKLGIVPVFAAGNSGPNPKTVGLPGGCPHVVTVGATDANDQAASFSSRGPAVWKTGSFTKPDVAAPGVKIMSSAPGGKYAELSGTSMATPHVAGLLALLFEAQPKLTVEQAVQLLRKSSDNVGQDPNTFGAGRVNAFKAASSL